MSCMATLFWCQRVGEIKAAAAGCRLPAGVWTFHLDICLPVTVLENEFTVRTLAAMVLAVYTVTERRTKACTTEIKSRQQGRHSVAMMSLLPLLLLQRRWWRSTAQTERAEGATVAEGLATYRTRAALVTVGQ